MMRRCLCIMLIAVAALLCGCAVHQWPEPESGTMVLHLHYEPDFWVWEHRYDPVQGAVEEMDPEHGVDEEHPGTSSRYSGEHTHGVMRTVIRVFRHDDLDRSIREFTFSRDVSEGYDCDIELDIEADDYVFAVWSDLNEQTSDAPYYEPSDFRRVQLVHNNYFANTDYRDGYRGRLVIAKPQNGGIAGVERYDITMRRPMAKYEFITTDLSEFLENETTRRHLQSRARIEDYVVEIRYPAYLPSSYSVIEDRLENSTTGVKFRSQVTITGESEASLGFDYVLINDTDKGGVQAEISVYDMNGERVAHSNMITVPLRRDHHTILRGAFLSMDARGGVGVDPGYDGDHNVNFN